MRESEEKRGKGRKKKGRKTEEMRGKVRKSEEK